MGLPILASKDPCTQCGECCKDFGGALPLTPEEFRNYQMLARKPFSFDSHVVGSARGINLISHYTIKTMPCVFYDDGCTIYADRPSICRAFPLGVMFGDNVFGKCEVRDEYQAHAKANTAVFSEQLHWATAPSRFAASIQHQLQLLGIRIAPTLTGAPEQDIDAFINRIILISYTPAVFI